MTYIKCLNLQKKTVTHECNLHFYQNIILLLIELKLIVNFILMKNFEGWYLI